jgi:hypothetical protein
MQTYIEEKENASGQFNSLRNTLKEKQANVDALKSQLQKVEASIIQLKEENTSAEKRAEYSLSLYNKVTNITWSEDASDHVAGCKIYLYPIVYHF